MVETATEVSGFRPGQEVVLGDIRQIVAPGNTLDLVEEARLRMVSAHINELLKGGLSPSEVVNHEDEIRYLGGEAVLEHLPGGYAL